MDVPACAQRLTSSLRTLDSEFKFVHFQIIDLLVKDHDLAAVKQAIFDEHEDKVSDYSYRLDQLIDTPPTTAEPAEKTILSRKMHYLERSVISVETDITSLPDDSGDIALLLEYEHCLARYKAQISHFCEELLTIGDILFDDPLLVLHANVERRLFSCSHVIRRHHARGETSTTAPTAPVASPGVKLPKLNVPTFNAFNGKILHWTQFWKQFCVAVHNRTNLSDTEKLVYLRQSLKDGTAKSVIEGLSRSGERYTEAIDCLKAQYNRPRLIH